VGPADEPTRLKNDLTATVRGAGDLHLRHTTNTVA